MAEFPPLLIPEEGDHEYDVIGTVPLGVAVTPGAETIHVILTLVEDKVTAGELASATTVAVAAFAEQPFVPVTTTE